MEKTMINWEGKIKWIKISWYTEAKLWNWKMSLWIFFSIVFGLTITKVYAEGTEIQESIEKSIDVGNEKNDSSVSGNNTTQATENKKVRELDLGDYKEEMTLGEKILVLVILHTN